MNAKERFDETIGRARAFIKLYRAQVDGEKNTDLIRAAAIMAVSALDMYAADRFLEGFVGYSRSHELTSRLEAFLTKSVELSFSDLFKLLNEKRERPYSAIICKIQDYLRRHSMQSLTAISKLYATIGLSDIVPKATRRIAKRAKLDTSVNALITRRNAIVHDADYDGNNRLSKINVEDIVKRINDVEKIVNAFEVVINNHFNFTN